eukprot:9053469-Karenia_brevis.AAC.1
MVAVRRQSFMLQFPPPPFRTVLPPLAVPPSASLRVLRTYADDEFMLADLLSTSLDNKSQH